LVVEYVGVVGSAELEVLESEHTEEPREEDVLGFDEVQLAADPDVVVAGVVVGAELDAERDVEVSRVPAYVEADAVEVDVVRLAGRGIGRRVLAEVAERSDRHG